MYYEDELEFIADDRKRYLKMKNRIVKKKRTRIIVFSAIGIIFAVLIILEYRLPVELQHPIKACFLNMIRVSILRGTQICS